MTTTTKTTVREIDDETLKVGDAMEFLGTFRRVVAIRPYVGPLADIVFAIADWDVGGGISLTRGGTCRIATVEAR